MAQINKIGIALPKFHAGQQEVLEAASIWLQEDPLQLALFERFLRSSQTLERYFVRTPEEIIALGSSKMRAELFEKETPKLAFEAAKNALDRSGVPSNEIDGLIFTSCSCPLIPAPDTYLIDQLELRRDIVRIPAYQFGCAGGVVGLGLASRLTKSLQNILLVSVELCSLVFQPSARLASDLVGAAIFGDGAAATVISQKESDGIEILAHKSVLLPESRHLMGYDIEDSGAHLRLDKELPSHLIHIVPKLVKDFLAEHHHTRTEVPWWLFHPGGTKILQFLQEVLELSPRQSPWAREILTSVGNLSSATILHVINRFQESGVAASGDKVLILGIGPGLTIEMILGKVTKE